MASSLDSPENAIEIVRGSTRTIQVTVTDLDDVIIDITSSRLLFCVKRFAEDEFPEIQKDTDVGAEGVLFDPRDGIARFFLVPADTHNLDFGIEYVYDVWLILPAGERHPVVGPAPFTVASSVTRIPL